MITTTYTTRDEAVEREIVAAIEAAGPDVARAEDFDVDAIAREVLSTDERGRWYLAVDSDEFWRSVEAHATYRVEVADEAVDALTRLGATAWDVALRVFRDVDAAEYPVTHPTGEWHDVYVGPALLAIGDDDDGVSWSIYRNADDDEELSSGGWTYDEPEVAEREIALIIETLARLGAEG